MIQTLRRRFILTAMLSLMGTLFLTVPDYPAGGYCH